MVFDIYFTHVSILLLCTDVSTYQNMKYLLYEDFEQLNNHLNCIDEGDVRIFAR